MRKFLMAMAATLAFVPAAVFAHGNMKPQHGGVVKMSGETVFELVVKPATVELPASFWMSPIFTPSAWSSGMA